MSLVDLVSRLARIHKRKSITLEDGKRVEVEHDEAPLLQLIRECTTSGIGPGSGNSHPGFSIPIASGGEVAELYARRVDEINVEYVKLRHKTHMGPEDRLIAWAEWFVKGTPGAAEEAAAVEWLQGMVEEFDELLNPPTVVEQLEACQYCGREHVLVNIDDEMVKKPALFVAFHKEDIANTIRLECRHCGVIATGNLAVTLELESLAKAA